MTIIKSSLKTVIGRQVYYMCLIALLCFSCSDDSESIQRLDHYREVIDNATSNKDLQSLKEVLSELKKNKELKIPDIYNKLGSGFRKLGDLEKAKSIANELLKMAQKDKDTFAMALAYHELAMYYDEKLQYDSLYTYYNKAAKYYTKVDSFRLAGYSYLSMGITQKNASDYIGAEASTIKTIEYLSGLDEDRYLASAYNNLGLIAKALDKPEKALVYFDRVIEYRQRVSSLPHLQAGTYNNIGIVYKGMHAYNNAIQWYDKGIAIKNLKQFRPSTYSRLIDNKGYALFKKGENNDAKRYLMDAYLFRDSINDLLGASTSALHLGEFYMSNGKSDTALNYLQEALTYSSETNFNTGRLQALKFISEIASPENAIKYAQDYIRVNDSIIDVERKLQEQFARIRYETNELEGQVVKVTKQKKQLSSILTVVAILSLLVYILKQRSVRKKDLTYQAERIKSNEEMYDLMISQNVKVQEAKLQEKRRISQELHDGVLSKLFGVRLHLDLLNTKKDDEAIKKRDNHLKELKEIGQEIRKISHDLQDNVFIAGESYPEVLEGYIQEYCKGSDLSYSFHYEDTFPWEALGISTKVHVYRVLQEALANIQKHAQAKTVDIGFSKKENHLVLTIDDDGKGLKGVSGSKGIGVKNMNARASEMSGSISIFNRKPAGVRLQLFFQ